uniref:UGP3-like C-terminal hexapeptide repeats domain-containing protein n=1 Tax=Oryza nivara TaxID=4536 RepID=A0A0E0HFS6_ORYNI
MPPSLSLSLSRSRRPPLIPSLPRSQVSPLPPLLPPARSPPPPPPLLSTPRMASRTLPPPHLRLDLCSPRLPPLRSPGCRRHRRRGRVLSALSSPSPSPSSASRSQSVSTAPLERGVGPGPATSREQPRGGGDPALAAELARLSALRARLRGARSLADKLRALDAETRVVEFFGEGSNGGVLGALEPREVFLLKCLVAAGQEHVLGAELDWDGRGHEHHHHHNGGSDGRSALRQALSSLAALVGKWSSEGVVEGVAESGESELLRRLLKFLGDIDVFYDYIGGIIGYQIMALELLSASKDHKHRPSKHKSIDFHVPSGLNLLEDTEYASQAALWGIEGLPELGEIYPIGGAGDRLGLVDSDTGESLPAALLPYCGRSLLEGLIRDLQAREFLHFKIFGKQCITPVAIMTSSVKDNHEHITAICERLEWFGRGRENFRLFEQPLVPVVNAKDGKWLTSGALFPVGKPGGHGAIWKLACDRGIFQWLYQNGRKGATVRQVSNVVAATDLTLMALAGIGLRHDKKLGFASCERRPGATEGVNVLIEKENQDGQWAYGITCIEYTEFEKYGIPEPTVTNGRLTIQQIQIYYMLICKQQRKLECTMQNIADNFMNTYNYRCSKGIESELDTFIVYNERKKVTSSAKRKLKSEDKSLHQVKDNCEYLRSGPPFLIFLHPALGPFWDITRQKFVGGSVSQGSELQIEVAEFLWQDVELDGSLIVLADNIMGSTNKNNTGEQIMHYGARCGRCKLRSVKIVNKGINWSSANNVYWKHDVERSESVKIILHENAEFEAKDVVLKGNHIFEVPTGHRMRIVQDGPEFVAKLDPISKEMMDGGTWYWKYAVDGAHVKLEMVEL